MQGTVKVANSPLNPSSPYHNAGIDHPEYDPILAKRLLDELAWEVGPDGIRRRDGLRFSFQLINRAGQADRIAVAQVIQAQLKAIGVEVVFETLEHAAWTSKWRNRQWEGVVSAWFLPADPSISGQFLCAGANNMTGLCDSKLDELY